MLKKIILTIFCLSLPLSLLADELQLAENSPTSYVVKKGDTLWDISGVFLKEPWLWPKLWRINPEIENPHLIYPGDELKLVYDAAGQPMLVKGKPKLKWSPKVRTSLKDLDPVETISLDVISAFIRYDTVFSAQEYSSAPYVISSDDGYKLNVDGLKLYVNGDLVVGQSYAVYQKEEAILDPETEVVVGYYASLVGSGKALKTGQSASKRPATLYLDGVMQEIRAGDIVKPINDNQSLPGFFTMQAADSGVNGHIVKAISGNREFGKQEVVFIDKGAQHGVKQGDLFSVNRKSPSVVESGDGPVYTTDASRWSKMASASDSDYDMPEETVGKMMVYKVFDQLSLAIIIHSTKPLRLQDTVTAP